MQNNHSLWYLTSVPPRAVYIFKSVTQLYGNTKSPRIYLGHSQKSAILVQRHGGPSPYAFSVHS